MDGKKKILKLLAKGALILGSWMVILLPGVICDLEYQGIIVCLQKYKWIKESIEMLRKAGFHYSIALALLQSSFGILVTVINLGFTLSISIVEQYDKLVYGLTRQKLEPKKQSQIYIHIKRMTYVTPFLLLLAIVGNLCATGYILLGFGYLFLLYNLRLYAKSYGKSRERELVIRYLVQSAKEGIQVADCLDGYCESLEYISRSIEKEGNWRDSIILFKELSDRLKVDFSDQESILQYYYINIVYMPNTSNAEETFFQLVKEQVNHLERVSKVEMREIHLFFGMLYNLFSFTKERIVLEFVQWFFNIEHRSSSYIISDGQKVVGNVQEIEIGVFLVFLEYWLECIEPNNLVEMENLDFLWKKANPFFKKNFACFDKSRRIFEMWLEISKVGRAFNVLKEDVEYGTSLSRICWLLERKGWK